MSASNPNTTPSDPPPRASGGATSSNVADEDPAEYLTPRSESTQINRTTSSVTIQTPESIKSCDKISKTITRDRLNTMIAFLGLVAGVVYFVLNYLNARATIELAFWKDCQDRPDMHDTDACKPYLGRNLTTIVKRGIDWSTSVLHERVMSKLPPLRLPALPTLSDRNNQATLGPRNLFLRLMIVCILATTLLSKNESSAEEGNIALRLCIYWCALCADAVAILGLEVLVIRRFPYLVIRWIAQTLTCCVIPSVCVMCVDLTLGFSNSASKRLNQVLGIVVTSGLVLISGGASAYAVLWLAPWHRLPEASNAIPSLEVALSFGTVCFVLYALFLGLFKEAVRMKSGRFEDFDTEQQRDSVVVQIPGVMYSVVKETLLGIYRAARGRGYGLTAPPTITKKTQ